jgi:hypothetical protein
MVSSHERMQPWAPTVCHAYVYTPTYSESVPYTTLMLPILPALRKWFHAYAIVH